MRDPLDFELRVGLVFERLSKDEGEFMEVEDFGG